MDAIPVFRGSRVDRDACSDWLRDRGHDAVADAVAADRMAHGMVGILVAAGWRNVPDRDGGYRLLPKAYLCPGDVWREGFATLSDGRLVYHTYHGETYQAPTSP